MSPRDSGLTLLELLVVVVLLSLLTLLIAGGIRFGMHARAEVTRQDRAFMDLDAVDRVFRQAVRGAYPEFASADLADRRIVFDGGPTSLTLVAPLPAAIEPGVFAVERFFLTSQAGGQTLVLAWRLDLPGTVPGTSAPEHLVPLLDHVGTIRFSYFGQPAPGNPARWSDRWSGATRLPTLVRLHIARNGPGLPGWPDLIAQPQVTATAACIYDPAESGCRRIR